MDNHILGRTEGTVKSMPETAAGPASTIQWRGRLPEGHPADLSTGRLAFLHGLSPDALLEDAQATRVCLDEVRDRIVGLMEKLCRAEAEVERLHREIDEAEGTYEDLSQDWDLLSMEIRCASERLASFLAGVEP